MNSPNPYATISCYFCSGDGCYCPKGRHKQPIDEQGRLRLRTEAEKAALMEECVSCDVCEGSGELSKKDVQKMVDHYKANDEFKKAWKSAM